MNPFEYHEARTVPEAIDLLGRYGDDAHAMAGGTALVLLLKQGLIRPGHIVGIRAIPELHGIRASADGGLELGAMTTHRQAETSPLVRDYCPALADAFAQVATVRIRNQATIGGNLVHADPAQDPPAILLALGGEVVLSGPAGERTVPLDAFFVDLLETAIEPGEVLTSIRLPALPATTSATYRKFLPNTRDDYATVAVAAALDRDGDGRCVGVRIGLAGAGSTPLRARAVEAALLGEVLTTATLDAAAASVEADVDPLDDVRGSADYKRQVTRVWVRRALEAVARPAPGRSAA